MPVARVHKTASPYNASELLELDYEQTADTVYIAHNNHQPTKLTRTDHTAWSFTGITFGPSLAAPAGIGGSDTEPNVDAANAGNAYSPQPASYVITAFSDDTGQESRASAAVTLTNDLALKRNYNDITWSAVSGATSYRVYKANNTGQYGLIGETTSLTFRDDNIGPDYSVGPPVADNPFSGAGNYPSTVTFHEQRSFWGRTINRPNAIYGSRSADYENMDYSKPQREDDALVLGLVANKVNSVNQLLSHKQGLIALTSHNIFSVQGSNEDYIVATPPPRVRPEISRGASRLNPISIDNVAFYEPSKLGGIRTIGYEFEMDGMKTDEVSIFSPHLFENHDIVDWCYAEKPMSVVAVVRDDGVALVLTWDQAQQVWGWTRLITDGQFKRCGSITEQGEDRIYFIVEREVNGETVHYIERMASAQWAADGQDYACYLDCAKTYINDVATATVDRLEHLEGMTVTAWVDAQAFTVDANGDPLVVTDGAITLPEPGLVITVGLPFTAEIETLPLAMQTGQGWSIARPQQAEKAILRVVASRNIKAGVDADQMFEIKMREEEAYGAPIDLQTGDFEVEIGGTNAYETSITVRSDDPTPMHIAAVMIEPMFGDK
jgi:hypothetical protein